MKSIKEREEKLEQLYKNLQQEWDAYKQSNSKTSRSRRYSHFVEFDHSNAIKTIQLLQSSPRLLMAALQQQSSTTIDTATQEIIQERREAIERGRYKCRRLFQSTDTRSELGSLPFCSSEDDEHGNKLYHAHSSSSSSCSPCLFNDFVAKEQEDMVATVTEERAANGHAIRPGIEMYIVFLGGIAIALLVFSVCMKSATSELPVS